MTSRPHSQEFDSCAQEPIHTPGCIQPYGFFMVCDSESGKILQCSENTASLISIPSETLRTLDLAELLGQESYQQLLEELGKSNGQANAPFRAEPGSEQYTLLARKAGKLLLLEFEPHSPLEQTDAFLNGFEESVTALQNKSTYLEIVETAAHSIRTFTGYDRVMVYKFDEEWNGQVVAESKAEELPAFLGLHYPASDIPPQARALYEKNLVRILVDAQAPAVPIHPVLNPLDGAPTDMGMVGMRAVSPYHLEYLSNMEVRATLTISIMLEGKLWGLIACHHSTPRFVGHRQRYACRMLGLALSSQIAGAINFEDAAFRAQLDEKSGRFFEKLTDSNDLENSLAGNSENLMELIPCDGAALLRGSKFIPLGLTPSQEQVMELLANDSTATDSGLFATHQISDFLPAGQSLDNDIAGVVIAPFSIDREQCLLWFRREQAQTVEWGGDPRKNVTRLTEGARLSPRKSFEKWVEIVQGTSTPWKPVELRGIERVRSLIGRLYAKQSLELERLNHRLINANSALDAFSYSVSHDLQAPLRRIKGFANLLFDSQVDQSNRSLIQSIDRTADSMSNLIEHLLAFARVGEIEDWRLQSVNLTKLAKQTFENEKLAYSSNTAILNIGELPEVNADRTLLQQLFANLFSNALKYSSSNPSPQISLSAAVGTAFATFCIKDNGVGFDSKNAKKLFDVFQRFHSQSEFSGSGIGLAIAKRIVLAHQGKIWAESESGQGASFYFTLPLAQTTN